MNQPEPRWVAQPVNLPPDVGYAHKLGRGRLLPEQIQELVKAINPAYVATKSNKAYLAQHQARAEMNRIFGYGNWDIDIVDVTLIYEEAVAGTGSKQGTTYYRACYRGKSVVTVRDLWGMPVASLAGVHAEANSNLPDRGEAHAMALTSLESYALRRALINLGDRFGLGLYNKGSMAAHGQYTIQLNPGVLWNWQQEGTPTAPVAPIVQPTHETIQAEQAASEDYTLEEPQQAPAQRAPQGERFSGALAQVQAGNEQARQAAVPPAMAARIQQGMKVDGNPDGAHYGPGNGEA